MKHVIEIYVRGEKSNKYLKAINPGGYAVTANIRYAKKYKTQDLAQGDCDLIAYFTNGTSVGIILPTP